MSPVASPHFSAVSSRPLNDPIPLLTPPSDDSPLLPSALLVSGVTEAAEDIPSSQQLRPFTPESVVSDAMTSPCFKRASSGLTGTTAVPVSSSVSVSQCWEGIRFGLICRSPSCSSHPLVQAHAPLLASCTCPLNSSSSANQLTGDHTRKNDGNCACRAMAVLNISLWVKDFVKAIKTKQAIPLSDAPPV